MSPLRGHSPYTASTRVVWPVVQTFRRERRSIGPLLSPFHLSEREVDDPDRRFPQDVVTGLWDRASLLTADPSFGLRALATLSESRRTLIDYVLLNSPTLGAMIDRGIRYERLWQEGREASLERDAGLAVLRWTARPGVRFSAPLSEFAVAMVVLMARRAVGERIVSGGGEVRFLHPAPPSPERYEALFGAPVRFSAGEQAIMFPDELLDVPLSRADSALFRVLDARAAEVLACLPKARSLAESVQRILAASLTDGDVSPHRVADTLHMSDRTLRRRLHDEGTSYKRLLDQFRRELSLLHLKDPTLGVTEVAFLLGFADGAAFTKAFRRWTGRNPTTARRDYSDMVSRDPIAL